MSDSRRLQEERLLELLAEQAGAGLDDAQARELAELLDEMDRDIDVEGLALAAAAAYRVFEQEADEVQEPMPQSLADRLIAQGEASVAQRAEARGPEPIPFAAGSGAGLGLRHPAWGWLAAAAVLVVSLTAFILTQRSDKTDYASLRAQLLQQAPDVTRVDWAGSDSPVYGKVTGDVVWSDQKQEGYMRLVGMPVNDPDKEQYQLWIVDPDVDSHPVDGGVFDVSRDGEVIVPIHAKLRVDKPTVFAITVERPGGVVVSDGPLEVVAPVG